MSFSATVRDEMLETMLKHSWTADDALVALAAFYLVSADSEKSLPLELRVSRQDTAELLLLLAKTLAWPAEMQSLGKRDYLLKINAKNEEDKVTNYDFPGFIDKKSISERWKIIAPIFVAAGSMSDPECRLYHLEIRPFEAKNSEYLCQLLSSMNLSFRISEKSGSKIVYVSSGDNIADFLRVGAAHLSLLRFEEIRARNELMATIHRQVNFDDANSSRLADANAKQIANIRLIEQTRGLKSLPEHLQQTANLRLEHPELPLADLANLVKPNISKSGMSHRMRKLDAIASKIKNKN